MEVSLRYQLTSFPCFLQDLTDSECNQKLPSKKGSLMGARGALAGSGGRAMSLRPQGTTVKASPLQSFSFSFFTLSHFCHTSACGFSAQSPFFFDSGVWVSMMALNIYSCFILCVFRRNTERSRLLGMPPNHPAAPTG